MLMKKAMIGDNEFEKWVESAHVIFEIFEGRFDAYPLASKWVNEWFDTEKFTVQKTDDERLTKLKENFNYEAFGIQDNEIRSKIDNQFSELLSFISSEPPEKNNVGFAISPYLFTWNFQRFKEYFKRYRNFSLPRYFQDLGKFIEDKKGEFQELRKKNLVKDEIEETSVNKVFNELNSKLKEIGLNHNEPVGTSKILHVISPHYFPLIDNKIAQAVGLKKRNQSLIPSDYYKWMVSLKEWLQSKSEIIRKLEEKFNLSILKLVDEGFYVMSSINLSLRLSKLGINV